MEARLISNNDCIKYILCREFFKSEKLTLKHDHKLYFKDLQSSVVIPARSLLLTRARQEGITNAFERMRNAAKNRIPKRLPILVSAHTASQYRVLDGNSTVAIAVFSDWPDVPCIVDTELATS